MQNIEKVQQAAQYLQSRLPSSQSPALGVVLGTGLGEWATSLQKITIIDYADIPGFPRSTVEGHEGKLLAGWCGDTFVYTLQGRFHLYEGYSPADVCLGVRTLAALGAKSLIITNAAGALNPQFTAGDLMVISDHINLTGANPLTGVNHDPWGPRFPDMSRVYSNRLQKLVMKTGLEQGIRLERGVYLGITGPNLETPAETRAFRRLGADAIGMSTVLEVIAAKHMGLEILGISCLTNKNLPDCMEETSLEDVLAKAKASSHKLEKILTAMICDWPNLP